VCDGIDAQQQESTVADGTAYSLSSMVPLSIRCSTVLPHCTYSAPMAMAVADGRRSKRARVRAQARTHTHTHTHTDTNTHTAGGQGGRDGDAAAEFDAAASDADACRGHRHRQRCLRRCGCGCIEDLRCACAHRRVIRSPPRVLCVRGSLWAALHSACAHRSFRSAGRHGAGMVAHACSVHGMVAHACVQRAWDGGACMRAACMVHSKGWWRMRACTLHAVVVVLSHRD
jgi:hypothetical protein